jgi:hypothetical protein
VRESEEIRAQTPGLTAKKIDQIAAWYKSYLVSMPAAQQHLVDDANRMVALAAIDEARGNEGGKTRNEALKKSITENDANAYDRASAAIIAEFPNLSVKWVDDTLAGWYSGWYKDNHDNNDIEKLATAATTFNAIIEVRVKFNAIYLLRSQIFYTDPNYSFRLGGNDIIFYGYTEKPTTLIFLESSIRFACVSHLFPGV